MENTHTVLMAQAFGKTDASLKWSELDLPFRTPDCSPPNQRSPMMLISLLCSSYIIRLACA